MYVSIMMHVDKQMLPMLYKHPYVKASILIVDLDSNKLLVIYVRHYSNFINLAEQIQKSRVIQTRNNAGRWLK